MKIRASTRELLYTSGRVWHRLGLVSFKPQVGTAFYIHSSYEHTKISIISHIKYLYLCLLLNNALFCAASAYRCLLFALIILFLVIDLPFALLMVSLGAADVTVHYILFLRCYFLVTASLGIERSSLLFFIYFD